MCVCLYCLGGQRAEVVCSTRLKGKSAGVRWNARVRSTGWVRVMVSVEEF